MGAKLQILQKWFSWVPKNAQREAQFAAIPILPMMAIIWRWGTFFKHKGFRDEREYRIAYNLFCDPYDPTKCLSLFSDNDHNKPYSFDVYQKEGMMVPFVDVDISSDSFQAVTLSPRIAAEYYADGLKLMLYKHGLWKNNINIQKSSIPIRF